MGLNERGEHYPWAKANLEAFSLWHNKSYNVQDKDIAQKWSTFHCWAVLTHPLKTGASENRLVRLAQVLIGHQI